MKRAKKYEPKIALKENIQWDDLINVALKPVEEKKQLTKAKRASGKKK